MTEFERLREKAKAAIEALFSHGHVPLGKTLDAMRELEETIGMNICMLEDDIQNLESAGD